MKFFNHLAGGTGKGNLAFCIRSGCNISVW